MRKRLIATIVAALGVAGIASAPTASASVLYVCESHLVNVTDGWHYGYAWYRSCNYVWINDIGVDTNGTITG